MEVHPTAATFRPLKKKEREAIEEPDQCVQVHVCLILNVYLKVL